jgi:hypothetical protein
MPAVTVPKGRVFHTLDALRGIAAIGVLVFHTGGAFTPLAAPGGYLAVDPRNWDPASLAQAVALATLAAPALPTSDSGYWPFC